MNNTILFSTTCDLGHYAGTPIEWGDLASTIGLIVKIMLGGMLAPIPYLLVGLGLVLGVYGWVLLIAMGQKNPYVDLFTQAFRGARPDG